MFKTKQNRDKNKTNKIQRKSMPGPHARRCVCFRRGPQFFFSPGSQQVHTGVSCIAGVPRPGCPISRPRSGPLHKQTQEARVKTTIRLIAAQADRTNKVRASAHFRIAAPRSNSLPGARTLFVCEKSVFSAELPGRSARVFLRSSLSEERRFHTGRTRLQVARWPVR